MLLEDFTTVVNTNSKDGLHTTVLKINKSHHLYNGHFPIDP
jgi:3-hydroxymyristoyl/3-hydroxydecanoyl-(acyl carrier protein) dehydratase